MEVSLNCEVPWDFENGTGTNGGNEISVKNLENTPGGISLISDSVKSDSSKLNCSRNNSGICLKIEGSSDCRINVSLNSNASTLWEENGVTVSENIQSCPASSANGDEDLSAMCKIVDDVETALEVALNSSSLSQQNALPDEVSEQSFKNKEELSFCGKEKEEDCAADFPVYKFDEHNFSQISNLYREFRCKRRKENFLKGCKWAPDGTCLLTNCEDKKLRIFDLPEELYSKKEWSKSEILPELEMALQVKEGGCIYDYCWYPLMNSWNPPSCCFASSSAKEPVHLWDGYNGELRASYRIYNYAEEIMSPLSLCFSPGGEKLYCGFKNRVDVFDVQYPGIKPVTFNTKTQANQSGLVSTIAVNPTVRDLFAVGTYQKTVGLYSARDNCGICVLNGHSGGLTHMMFSPDGPCLYTGSRMDPEIVCWDLRQPGKVLFSLYRNVSTNQRIYFDLTPDGKTLVSGDTDGNINVWNLGDKIVMHGDNGPLLPDFTFRAHKDCSNGVRLWESKTEMRYNMRKCKL